ncbi:MAG: S-layer homology domain-containing protein [Clostridia bacterium]|nr:S-layer homology domain-containing protein [Clostridia bacterium]
MKKIISVILACVMLILCIPASAKTVGFPDVKEGAWYYDAVTYCSEKGIFNGNKDGSFAPAKSITRAEFVVALANYSGEDITTEECDRFTDIKPSHWYYRATAWAANKGIVSGTSDNTYSPSKQISRQDLCLMLMNYLKYKEIELEADMSELFADDAKIGTWAKEAVYAIKTAGIVAGMGENKFDPRGNATRAQVAQMMMQFDKFMESAETSPMKIENVKITIPGVKTPVKFMHISDSHLTLFDETDSEKAVAEMTERGKMFDTQVGDGIPREDKLAQFYAMAAEEGVDQILLSGDIIDAPSNANMKFLADLVNNSKIPSIYTLGNHDWSFSDNYQGERDKYMPGFTDIFGETDPDTEEKYWDSVCNVYEYDGFVLVVADNSTDQVHSTITSVLKTYAKAGTPVILMLHVPVSCETAVADVTNMWGRDITIGSAALNPNAATKQFVEFIRSEESSVVAILAGHTHLSHIDDVSPNNNTVQYTLGASFEGYTRIFEITGE